MAAVEKRDLAELSANLGAGAAAPEPTEEKLDLTELMAQIALSVLGNNRRRREEIVPKILEAFVLRVLEDDPRFVGSTKGLFWERAEVREQNELDRRAQEERNAAAALAGQPAEMARLRAQAIDQGITIIPGYNDAPDWEPGDDSLGVLDDEEAAEAG